MKQFLSLLIAILLYSNSWCQITLTHTFPSNLLPNVEFGIEKFGHGGDKYVLNDDVNQSIEIYNSNFSLDQIINIPGFAVSSNNMVAYVTDNLFDLDSSVEYVVTVNGGGAGIMFYVLNDDGSVVFSRDSIDGFWNVDPFLTSKFSYIVPTSSGTEMHLLRMHTGWEIYSLPGNLPCYECTDGSYSGIVPSGNENRSSLSNPYPNPANNFTRIDYALPEGIHKGEIIFHNIQGIEVKRFIVTDRFSYINVSIKDIPSGTYYYVLSSSEGMSEGKKMVVIK